MKKFISMFVSISLLLLMFACGKPSDPSTPTTTTGGTTVVSTTKKVSLEAVTDYLALAATAYNFIAPVVHAALPPDSQKKFCEVVPVVQKFWNLGITGLQVVYENKGQSGKEQVIANLTSFNEAIAEIFTLPGVDPKYKMYVDAILAASKIIFTTFIENLEFTEGDKVDLSLLKLTFECPTGGKLKPVVMSAQTNEPVKDALKNIPSEGMPAEIQALKDALK